MERLFASALGTLDWLTVYVGERLGLYRALAQEGPLTAAELAAHAGVNERYAREWLEQQTVGGIIDVDLPEAGPNERCFVLPAGHAEVLLDETSLFHIEPLAPAFMSVDHVLPQVLEAFRTGGGVGTPNTVPTFGRRMLR